MNVTSLIFKEIRHRKINFLLGVLAVAMAVALSIGFFTASKGAERETARIMLALGYNLHIIPADTDMGQFLITGIPDATMPEAYLEKLANQNKVSYNHLLANLQKQLAWRDMQVVVTGLAPEGCPPGRTKPPMIFEVEPGTVYVGHQIAERLGLKKGDQIEVAGKTLTVAKCLAESGNSDDIRLQCHIDDAQAILGLPGRISEIRAVDCLCFADTNDPTSILRKQVNAILPDARVYHVEAIGSPRTKARQMIKNLFAVIMPFVIIACGVWVGIVAVMNVRDRQQEIGILRALGHDSERIAGLFLGKAVVIGVVGTVVGFAAGTYLALRFGPSVFKITAERILQPEWSFFFMALVLAPIFAATASFIPTMLAVAYDPAVTLREE